MTHPVEYQERKAKWMVVKALVFVLCPPLWLKAWWQLRGK